MIILKTSKELEIMKKAGRISALALKLAGEYCKPGVSTRTIDDAVKSFIISEGATPSFLGYNGFPASICISVNNEVIHGIPSDSRTLKDGDIVSVDIGAKYGGYHGDNAYTFAVGNIGKNASGLLKVTEECLYAGIEFARPGFRIGDVSNAIQTHAEKHGYGVVKSYIGHGIGKNLHEEPEVPNYGKPGRGVRLVSGMVIAIEPMINEKGADTKVMPDGWTVKTKSGGLSAHFEHTVAITNGDPLILTLV